MELKQIRKDTKPERRSVIISVRTFPRFSRWMKENKISPSKLFNVALKELILKLNKNKRRANTDDKSVEASHSIKHKEEKTNGKPRTN